MFFKKRKPINIGLISDQYSLDWKFAENSVADAYRAYDRVAKRHCTLWITRESLDETNRRLFYEHLSSLADESVEKISRYGSDETGISYVALSFLAVKRLDYDAPQALVKSQRFLQAVLRIEALHLRGVSCGNLCYDSFMLDSDEQVHFVGYPGGKGATKYSDLPLKYQKFIPPDMIDGAETSQAVDVYALAVIGLSLFGVTFPDAPITAQSCAECVTSIDPNAPSWARTILTASIRCAPQERYKSASKLLAVIAAQVNAQRLLTAESLSAQDTTRSAREESEALVSLRRSVFSQQVWIRRALHSPWFVVGGVCLFLGLAVAELGGIIELSHTGQKSERGGLTTIKWKEVFNERPGVDQGLVSSDAAAPVPPLGAVVEIPKDSNKRVSAELAVNSPIPKFTDNFRRELSLAKAAGYPLTAEVLGYLVNAPSTIRPGDIAELLKVLRPDLSKEQRRDMVVAYESIDADLAYMLAASFSIDLSDQELLRDLIVRGALKQIGVSRSPIDAVGTFALMTAIPSARDLVFKRILEQVSSMSDADVWWLLETLALQRAEEFRELIATQRVNQLAPGYHRFCLQGVARVSDMEGVPVRSLLRCARQKPNIADVQQFSQWYDPASVKVLLAILLMSPDLEVLESSFDALSSKSTGSVSVDEAVSYINNSAEAPRASYAPFIGGVGLLDSLTEDEINTSFSSIRGRPNASQLGRLLLRRGSSALVKAILGNLGDTINPALLIELLQHPDKSVRLNAIPLVKDVSLSSSWQSIVDAYLTESDAEVKARYESEIPRIRGF
jgi:hypothetical protein